MFKFVEKKKFVAVTFNLDYKIFVVYIAFLVSFNPDVKVYLSQQVLIVSLKNNKTLISIFSKYNNFADIFFKDLAAKFLKQLGINNYTMDLI